MERENVEEMQRVDKVDGLCDIYREVLTSPSLSAVRIPVVEETAPKEESFDILVSTLKGEKGATNCVFSCQAGRGRTTLGMVVACFIKEIQISSELRRMEEIGLLPESTVKNIIKSKFEFPLPKTQVEDDPFIKGEFDVIKELLEKLPGAKEGKSKVDRVIDICGPAPKGTGLQNLRECIIETKWKYDVAPEDKQLAFKQMIINFIERYFYILCFATYSLDLGFKDYSITFTDWIKERPELITMATEGKDKLEWSRTVDSSKLETLKALMADPNYKDNLNVIIRTIYDFAYMTYADLPRGAIKNNSMKKLAANTLMEILPEEMQNMIMKKLDEDPTMTHDFLTIVGLVSYC